MVHQQWIGNGNSFVRTDTCHHILSLHKQLADLKILQIMWWRLCMCKFWLRLYINWEHAVCIVTVSIYTVTMMSINNGTCSFVIRVNLVAISISYHSSHHLKHIQYSKLNFQAHLILLQNTTNSSTKKC